MSEVPTGHPEGDGPASIEARIDENGVKEPTGGGDNALINSKPAEDFLPGLRSSDFVQGLKFNQTSSDGASLTLEVPLPVVDILRANPVESTEVSKLTRNSTTITDEMDTAMRIPNAAVDINSRVSSAVNGEGPVAPDGEKGAKLEIVTNSESSVAEGDSVEELLVPVVWGVGTQAVPSRSSSKDSRIDDERVEAIDDATDVTTNMDFNSLLTTDDLAKSNGVISGANCEKETAEEQYGETAKPTPESDGLSRLGKVSQENLGINRAQPADATLVLGTAVSSPSGTSGSASDVQINIQREDNQNLAMVDAESLVPNGMLMESISNREEIPSKVTSALVVDACEKSLDRNLDGSVETPGKSATAPTKDIETIEERTNLAGGNLIIPSVEAYVTSHEQGAKTAVTGSVQPVNAEVKEDYVSIKDIQVVTVENQAIYYSTEGASSKQQPSDVRDSVEGASTDKQSFPLAHVMQVGSVENNALTATSENQDDRRVSSIVDDQNNPTSKTVPSYFSLMISGGANTVSGASEPTLSEIEVGSGKVDRPVGSATLRAELETLPIKSAAILLSQPGRPLTAFSNVHRGAITIPSVLRRKRADSFSSLSLEDDDDDGEEAEPAEDDEELCNACGDWQNPETMLLCDECNRGFHMRCLRPPLTAVPETDWFCPDCVSKRIPKPAKKPRGPKKPKETVVPQGPPLLIGEDGKIIEYDDGQPCEVCRSWKEWDSMLLCDLCDRAYHMKCLRPPLFEIPTGDWYCPVCDLKSVDGGTEAARAVETSKRSKKEYQDDDYFIDGDDLMVEEADEALLREIEKERKKKDRMDKARARRMAFDDDEEEDSKLISKSRNLKKAVRTSGKSEKSQKRLLSEATLLSPPPPPPKPPGLVAASSPSSPQIPPPPPSQKPASLEKKNPVPKRTKNDPQDPKMNIPDTLTKATLPPPPPPPPPPPTNNAAASGGGALVANQNVKAKSKNPMSSPGSVYQTGVSIPSLTSEQLSKDSKKRSGLQLSGPSRAASGAPNSSSPSVPSDRIIHNQEYSIPPGKTTSGSKMSESTYPQLQHHQQKPAKGQIHQQQHQSHGSLNMTRANSHETSSSIPYSMQFGSTQHQHAMQSSGPPQSNYTQSSSSHYNSQPNQYSLAPQQSMANQLGQYVPPNSSQQQPQIGVSRSSSANESSGVKASSTAQPTHLGFNYLQQGTGQAKLPSQPKPPSQPQSALGSRGSAEPSFGLSFLSSPSASTNNAGREQQQQHVNLGRNFGGESPGSRGQVLSLLPSSTNHQLQPSLSSSASSVNDQGAHFERMSSISSIINHAMRSSESPAQVVKRPRGRPKKSASDLSNMPEDGLKKKIGRSKKNVEEATKPSKISSMPPPVPSQGKRLASPSDYQRRISMSLDPMSDSLAFASNYETYGQSLGQSNQNFYSPNGTSGSGAGGGGIPSTGRATTMGLSLMQSNSALEPSPAYAYHQSEQAAYAHAHVQHQQQQQQQAQQQQQQHVQQQQNEYRRGGKGASLFSNIGQFSSGSYQSSSEPVPMHSNHTMSIMMPQNHQYPVLEDDVLALIANMPLGGPQLPTQHHQPSYAPANTQYGGQSYVGGPTTGYYTASGAQSSMTSQQANNYLMGQGQGSSNYFLG